MKNWSQVFKEHRIDFEMHTHTHHRLLGFTKWRDFFYSKKAAKSKIKREIKSQKLIWSKIKYWTHILSEDHFWAFLNISEHFWTFLNISEHYWTFLNIFEHFRTFQIHTSFFSISFSICWECMDRSELHCVVHNVY